MRGKKVVQSRVEMEERWEDRYPSDPVDIAEREIRTAHGHAPSLRQLLSMLRGCVLIFPPTTPTTFRILVGGLSKRTEFTNAFHKSHDSHT